MELEFFMGVEAGQLVGEQYRIVRLIQSGGMGSVWLAQDLHLTERECAVKVILDADVLGQNSQYIHDTFEKEMRALVELHHPGIPTVHNFFQEGDLSFIVMDFIRGQSLQDEVSLSKAGLEPGRVVVDMLQVLDIVDYLHRLKPPILHRDIKPANLIREQKSGAIKLVDFGLAKAERETGAVQTMAGTWGYSAPEQLSGKGEIRSDLYSVAATMQHLLTGQPPQLSFDPLELKIPGLDKIVARGTEPRLSDRYPSARAMAADLRAWQHGLPGEAPETPVGEREAVDGKANRWAWIAVVSLAAGVGLWLGRASWETPPNPEPSPVSVFSPESSPTPPLSSSPRPIALLPKPPPLPPIHRHPRPAPPAVRPPPPRPLVKILDKRFFVNEFEIHIEGYPFDVKALVENHQGSAAVARALMAVATFRRSWALDSEASAGDGAIIAMKGAETGGGYVVRPEGHVFVVSVTPAPPQNQQTLKSVAQQISKIERMASER